MWFDNPTFSDIDARLQTSKFISTRWNEEIAKRKFVNVKRINY